MSTTIFTNKAKSREQATKAPTKVLQGDRPDRCASGCKRPETGHPAGGATRDPGGPRPQWQDEPKARGRRGNADREHALALRLQQGRPRQASSHRATAASHPPRHALVRCRRASKLQPAHSRAAQGEPRTPLARGPTLRHLYRHGLEYAHAKAGMRISNLLPCRKTRLHADGRVCCNKPARHAEAVAAPEPKNHSSGSLIQFSGILEEPPLSSRLDQPR